MYDELLAVRQTAEVRIPVKDERTIYKVEIIKRKQQLLVKNVIKKPELFGKVLHHQHISVNYQTSLFEI